MSQLTFTFVYDQPAPEPASQEPARPSLVLELPVPEPAAPVVTGPEPVGEAPQVTFSFV